LLLQPKPCSHLIWHIVSKSYVCELKHNKKIGSKNNIVKEDDNLKLFLVSNLDSLAPMVVGTNISVNLIL